MRSIALFSLAMLTPFSVAAQDASVEQAMDAIVQRFSDGFRAGDASAIASLYAEDGDAGGFSGRIWTGRTSIQEAFADSMNAYTGSTVQFTRSGLHPVGLEVVVLDVSWKVTAGTPSADAPLEGFMTLILAKQGDAWQVVSSRAKIPPPAN